MKKLLAISLAALMIFSFAACGMTAEEELQSYIDNAPDTIASLKETAENSGMGVEVKAKDTAMVFTYIVSDDVAASLTEVEKTAMQQALKASDATMQPALQQAKSECDVLGSIIIEYKDKSGNVIASYEYK